MSMKVMKVDGSVDESSGLKYTAGDKFQGLLSRTIDKALGGMQESSEDAAQNNHPVNSVQNSSTEASNDTHEDPTHFPPEWGSTWSSQTASAKSRTNEEKAIPDKTTTEKAESENVVAESVSAQQVSTEKVMVEKAAEEKVAIAKKSTVANVAVEEDAAKTNYAYEHDDGAAGCTKGRWTISDWKKSESTQDSWVASTDKWFADEKEDTGLQTAENSKFFGIASSIKSFSNEGKELIIQYRGRCSCPGCACEENDEALRSAVIDLRRKTA